MRILFLHSSSDLYGASKIGLQSVDVLQKNGHHCIVVLSAEGPLADAFRARNIPVHILPLGIIRRQYFSIKGILDRIQKWRQGSKALRQLIQQETIDMVYSNTAAVLIGGYVAKKNKIKHIWHIHEIIEKPRWLHAAIAWCMRNWCDQIIIVSKAVSKHWRDAGNKIERVYNGLPPMNTTDSENYRKLLNIPKEALVIGMAGRVHYWKGQDYFLDIATALHQLQPDLYFILVGDAFPGYEYLEEKIKTRIAQSSVKESVFYLGYCEEMQQFYSAIDLLVLPSTQPDPLPTVVLEAMSAGKMVVATKQGGALEMIQENETGIFIPLNDPALAAAKIIRHLQRDQLREMGQKGKMRVEEHFSLAAFEKNLINVIDSV